MSKSVISHPVTPREGYILIKRIQEKQVGGFAIKQEVGMSDITGEVVAIGDPVIEHFDNGEQVSRPFLYKMGDTIVYKSLSGIPFGNDYKLLAFEDVVGIINAE